MYSMTETQVQLQDSAKRYFSRNSDTLTGRRNLGGFSKQWEEFTEMGWMAAPVTEILGGYGGAAELALISREIGYAGCEFSFIHAAVIPGIVISQLDNTPFQKETLEAIFSGDRLIYSPLVEQFVGGRSMVTCIENDTHFQLSGTVSTLPGASYATDFCVLAQSGQGVGNDAGYSLFIVPADSEGLRADTENAIDGRLLQTITFSDVKLDEKQRLSSAATESVIQSSINAAVLAQCADLVGCTQKMFDLTKDYLQIRKQFGSSLAEFQALRHRLADMYAELCLANAMLKRAVDKYAEDPVDSHSISAAKYSIANAAKYVGTQAIQLHGAIAMTEEYELGRYFKRAIIAEKTFGDPYFHLHRFKAT